MSDRMIGIHMSGNRFERQITRGWEGALFDRLNNYVTDSQSI